MGVMLGEVGLLAVVASGLDSIGLAARGAGLPASGVFWLAWGAASWASATAIRLVSGLGETEGEGCGESR
jgi:hypothetical protein